MMFLWYVIAHVHFVRVSTIEGSGCCLVLLLFWWHIHFHMFVICELLGIPRNQTMSWLRVLCQWGAICFFAFNLYYMTCGNSKFVWNFFFFFPICGCNMKLDKIPYKMYDLWHLLKDLAQIFEKHEIKEKSIITSFFLKFIISNVYENVVYTILFFS